MKAQFVSHFSKCELVGGQIFVCNQASSSIQNDRQVQGPAGLPSTVSPGTTRPGRAKVFAENPEDRLRAEEQSYLHQVAAKQTACDACMRSMEM